MKLHGSPVIVRFIATLGLLALLLGVAACRTAIGPDDVDGASARAHLDMLAGTIGSRPIGSAANARARAYLVDALTSAGFHVRLQRAEGTDNRSGLPSVTAPAVNIVAWLDGVTREAVALVSHYDSVPDGPGALDDALGVTVCLEAATRLIAEPRRHSLFVIITDGEEAGLLGARAAVRDPEIAARVRAFLNFDGTGAAGPLLMFETGPGRGSAFEAWARAAPRPEGASFTTEIYRRLPNDTDFTAFRTIGGASGLNFAPVLDSYAYHTDRDVPARVQTATLTQGIANTIAIVRALDRVELTAVADLPTYFSVFGRAVVLYGAGTTRALAGASLALALVAWIVMLVTAARPRGIAGAMLTAGWSIVTTAAIFGAAVGATWGLRWSRGQLNPWYAVPQWYFAFILAAGWAGGWLVRRLAWSMPARLRPLRGAESVWLTALPAWAGLAGLTAWAAPAASYLVVVPLFVAGLALTGFWRTEARVRLASLAVLVVSLSLWVANLSMLLRFLVAMFGWFPIVAPAWMFPAVMGVGALMIAPPMAGALGPHLRARLTGRATGVIVLGALLVAGAAAFRAPAFTEDRPEVRSARYVQDGPGGEAWWEVASLEATLDLEGGPADAAWTPAAGPLQTSSALILRRPAPFVFRTRVRMPDAAPPVQVDATTADLAPGQVAYDVRVVIRPTRDPAFVELTLPRGVEPLTSSLAGTVTRDGTWRAAYVSPPPEGLSLHLVLPADARAALAGAVVTLQVPGVPGGDRPEDLPSWLPVANTSWRAYSWYLVSAAPQPAAR